MKRYSDLILLKTFKERLEYCKTSQAVGDITFGGARWLNQQLYKSPEWKNVRNRIIIRDEGCDLGILDRPIGEKTIVIHHLNPVTKEQLLKHDSCLFDPENLICCCLNTHNTIHYNSDSTIVYDDVERRPNDTIPWR